MSYQGDIRLGDTIDVKFTTRQSSGAPTTLAGSPVISAYVGNGTTEITAGITLTVDFDSRTGLNNVRVVATSGNGFATATNVQLVITTGTVNSVSVVGEVVGEFSIENRSALMPTTAGRTIAVDGAGLADANTVKMGPTGSGVAQTGIDIGAAVTNIGQSSSPISKVADSRTITTGTGEVNTYTSTAAADGTYHSISDSAGSIDFYYEATLPTTGGALTGVNWLGYVVGVVNTIKVYIYNWTNSGWDQVGSVVGIAGTTEMDENFEATNDHTGTGGNALKVRFRFSATGLTAATVKTDRLLFGYTVVSTYQSGDAFALIGTTGSGLTTITNRLPSALVGGRMDSSLGAIAVGVDLSATMKTSVQTAADAAITANATIVEIEAETDAIQAKTDNLPASPAAVGSAMTLTAAYDSAKTAASVAAIFANAIESGVTFAQMMEAIGAALAGKRSNAGTVSEQYDAVGNAGTPRVVSNLDSSGNGTPTLTL